MANEYIRAVAKQSGVRLWELADVLGVSEPTITRRMRHDLGETERARFLEAINTVARSKQGK